jgi:heterodisulfide reductase subunit C
MLYSLYRGMEDSNLCMDCQQCVAVCPVRRAKKDYFGPRGIMIAARAGNMPMALDGNIFSCTSCMACVESCPRGLNVKHVMDRCRYLLAQDDKGQYPAHKHIINMAKSHGNVYEEKPKFKPDVKTQKEGVMNTLNTYGKIVGIKDFEIGKKEPEPPPPEPPAPPKEEEEPPKGEIPPEPKEQEEPPKGEIPPDREEAEASLGPEEQVPQEPKEQEEPPKGEIPPPEKEDKPEEDKKPKKKAVKAKKNGGPPVGEKPDS